MTTSTAQPAAAPKQRKPRPRPARKLALVQPLDALGRNGLLRLSVGKTTDEYILGRVPSDFGEGFTLAKRCYAPGEEDAIYHVDFLLHEVWRVRVPDHDSSSGGLMHQRFYDSVGAGFR